MKNKLLIFGYGYVAKALCEKLQDFEIISTSRSEIIFNLCKIVGFKAEDIKKELDTITHIISTIPPDQILGDPVLYNFKYLIKNAPCLKYICYLSATSVYGNHNGNWVDENTTLRIENQRARIRHKAELEWLGLTNDANIPIVVMRISGIYGPGRNVLDKIRDGSIQYFLKKDQIFSRVHIDDIVTALTISLEQDIRNNIYNLSDDLPSPQYEVIEYAAELLNIKLLDPLNFEDANLSPMMREFYMSSKKVSNNKIKKQLGLNLKYPSYKEGLISLLC